MHGKEKACLGIELGSATFRIASPDSAHWDMGGELLCLLTKPLGEHHRVLVSAERFVNTIN